MQEKFVNNNGLEIQYILLNHSTTQTPLIFIPGAIVSADDIYNDLKKYIPFYCIIISLRGLGKSGVPESGYSQEHFISDIDAVIKNEGITKFYILGHSMGAGLAAGYSVKYPEKISGLIMVDYPPGYPSLPQEWADDIRKSLKNVNENFIQGMVRESVKTFYLEPLSKYDFKKLIIKASGEDSLLPLELANKLSEHLTNTTFKIIDNCGHEMFSEKPNEIIKIIEDFM